MKKLSIFKKGALLLVVTLLIQTFSIYVQRTKAIPSGYLEFYVPTSTQQVWDIMTDHDNDPDLVEASGLHNVIAATATLDGTTVYYDHWEDGYDFDPNTPATADETYTLDQGDVQEFESSNIPVSPRGSSTFYDGRDRIYVAGGPVTVTYAAWPESTGSVYSFAYEVYPVKPLTTNYTMPVGEDLAAGPFNYSDFTKVYLVVQALEDGTTVVIDDPTVVGDQVNVVLNRGEVTQYYHPKTGTTIVGSNPVQAQFFSGEANAGQSSQINGFTLVPDTLWSNSVYTPVGSFGAGDTDLFIYNPNPGTITINFEDTTGSGSFTIASHATKSYRDGAGRFVPLNSGAHLTSASIFWGIAVSDTESASYDWGYSLVPDTAVTEEYFLGWAPGSSEAVPSVNGSPVFVTATLDDTTVFVDYSPVDGITDDTYNLNKLESQKIFDPDNENTGMHITATNPIVAAWGEDLDTASTGTPYLDMGYTVLPITTDWVDVVLLTDKTANPEVVYPGAGQTSVFTITTSTATFPVDDVDVVDDLPPGWDYVAGSTTITLPNSSTITGGAADPSVLGQELTWNLTQDMLSSETLTIQFTGITNAGALPGYNQNQTHSTGTRISGAQVFSPTAVAYVYIPVMTVDLDTTTPSANAGGTATYTLALANPGSGALTNVTGNITLPTGFTYASASILETSATRNTVSNPSVGATTPSWGTWTINAGGSVVITVTVNVGGAVPVGTYDATAGAFSTQTGAIDDAGTVAQDPDTPIGADPETDEDITISVNNASIGDFVWNDLNGDGFQDLGEPGIAGVTLDLISDLNGDGDIDLGEPVLSTQTTNGSGAYDFTGLAADDYIVDVTDTGDVLSLGSSGFTLTGGTDPIAITLTPNQDYNNADFGFQQTDAVIGDFVWNDLNGDGIQDLGEPGIAGVTLDLISDLNGDGDVDLGEPVIDTTTTNGSGNYSFDTLPAGDYIVELTDTGDVLDLSGGTFSQSAGTNPIAVTGLTAGQNFGTADFGFQQTDGVIGDLIWNDADKNGVQEGAEAGIANVTLDLINDLNSNGLADFGEPVIASQMTDSFGAYSFSSLAAGNYVVNITDTLATLTGWIINSPSVFTTPVVLTAGQNFDDADYGFYQAPDAIPLPPSPPGGGCVGAGCGGGTPKPPTTPPTPPTGTPPVTKIPGKKSPPKVTKTPSLKPSAPEKKGKSTLTLEEYMQKYPLETFKRKNDDFLFTKVIPKTGAVSDRLAGAYHAASLFPDTSLNHPYYQAAVGLYLQEVISGYDNHEMHLDSPIMRSEAAKVLARAAEFPVPQNFDAVFSDTVSGEWYQPYINYMFYAGIMSGYDNGRFGPHDNVTVGQALKMVSGVFGDLVQAREARANESWVVPYYEAMGAINALPASMIDTDAGRPVTRGELFEMIYRLVHIEDIGLMTYDDSFALSVPELNIHNVPVNRTLLSTVSVWLSDLVGGAGFYEDTRPGREGNLVVFAHSSMYKWDDNSMGVVFHPFLEKLWAGQHFEITRNGVTERYQITSKAQYRETNVSKIRDNAPDFDLVVFTCDDDIAYRWVFLAKKVQ